MKIEIDEDLCKGCELCISICPKNVIEKSNKTNREGYLLPIIKNSEDCIKCRKCELICPEMAISIYVEENSK
ncbi:MAG: 4Fe-4S dicluster domain-containing protein [Candidatus Lokiarchaeota archaeon]|nr:4Fe-4S dicluster domain-containing protein [Candidatus Lokiarchaeota archaeon]